MPLRLTCDAELLKDRKPEEQNWGKACVWAAGFEITWRPEAFSAFHCKRGSRPGRGSPPPHASRSPWPTLRRQSESRSGPTKAFHAVRRQSRPRCLPWRCRTFLRPKGKGLMPGAGRVAVHVFMWELRSHHNAQRCHSLAAQGSMFCFLDTSSVLNCSPRIPREMLELSDFILPLCWASGAPDSFVPDNGMERKEHWPQTRVRE